MQERGIKMKELELKLNELEEELKNVDGTMLNIKVEIEHCKKLKLDYLSYEMIYNKCNESKKEIERKINIINNAMDILEGIE